MDYSHQFGQVRFQDLGCVPVLDMITGDIPHQLFQQLAVGEIGLSFQPLQHREPLRGERLYP